MLYSNSHQFLFVHIPKTAGSSVKAALQTLQINTPRAITEDPRFINFLRQRSRYLVERGMVFPSHIRVAEIQALTSIDVNRVKIFSIVRDPLSRLNSLYQHYRRDPSHPAHQIATTNDFEAFLGLLIANRPPFPHPDSLPQIDYLLDHEHRLSVDYLVLFERLSTGFELLQRQLGIAQALNHENKAPASSENVIEISAGAREAAAYYEREILRVVPYPLSSPEPPPAFITVNRASR